MIQESRNQRSPSAAPSHAAQPTINLIWRRNLVGLSRDASILRALLEASGFTVRDLDPRSRNAYRDRFLHWLRRPFSRDSFYPFCANVNIALEKCFPRWHWTAETNLLLLNPEWCPKHLLRNPRAVDLVLCKTEHALDIFSRLGCRTALLGFTSADRKIAGTTPDYDSFLHLAGSSLFKGTEAVLDVWSRHPEWPRLTVVRHLEQGGPRDGPNIDLREEYLADDELRLLQNQCGIHLLPSTVEGWGHAHAEAMSCGAVVLTTDGPPMNELVRPDRGFLVPWYRKAPHRLGTDYFVDPVALEQAIEHLMQMSTEEKLRMGLRARNWFEANHARFEETFRRMSTDWLRGPAERD